MSKIESAAKLGTVLAAAALASACATGPYAPPTQNTGVSNRPENTGPKEYGSEACRKAKVEPMEAGAWGQRSRMPQYSPFARYLRSNPAIAGQFGVTSENGIRYTLVSQATESHWGSLVGAAGGVAIANPGGSGSRTGRAARTVIGAGLGAIIGGTVDAIANNGVREAFERCRLDVMEGAYDPPNVRRRDRPLGAADSIEVPGTEGKLAYDPALNVLALK